jgi:peptidoglycan-associated lipoprotein
MGPRGDGLPGNPVTDVSFERVAFLYDSFQIADSERGKIETVGNYMNSNADVTAYIDGHCDERGSREYNLSLSEHRALAIRAYLISLGVGGDRILTRSFGEEQPLDLGHSKSAWRQNRRGEFSLYR